MAAKFEILSISSVPPPNYQSIKPYNFGGTADLYQNVTQIRNSEMQPPSYKSLDNNSPINIHV